MLLMSSFQVDMDLSYLKVVMLVNACILADASPVAMVQHATSSQSIVIHQPRSGGNQASVTNSPALEHFGNNQPKYEYKYEVSDHETGDRKSHWESRDGDKVRGVYTLYEPDGALRTVEYTADSIHGFNAVVRRDEPSNHLRRLQEPYNRSSAAFDGNANDASASSSRYSETTRLRERSVSTYKPGVRFSVSHKIPLKKQDNFIPY